MQLGNITDQHPTEAVLYRNILELFLWDEKFYLFQLPKEGVSQSALSEENLFPEIIVLRKIHCYC